MHEESPVVHVSASGGHGVECLEAEKAGQRVGAVVVLRGNGEKRLLVALFVSACFEGYQCERRGPAAQRENCQCGRGRRMMVHVVLTPLQSMSWPAVTCSHDAQDLVHQQLYELLVGDPVVDIDDGV
ncbi:hypothetical protein E2C01_097321 [Portunus trituberculatus]|uniref:Uncharacterized protein n=1 Tax=Portunus trituberculatus TaxID=210409 RepID=A0A5B7K997_PORTR|nr:hypothetical protein [Portunus trituberculatus]